MAKRQVPVSPRAIIQRVNRKLASEHQRLCKARPGSRAEQNFGTYYLLDVDKNTVTGYVGDLSAFAKEHDALADWEVIAED